MHPLRQHGSHGAPLIRSQLESDPLHDQAAAWFLATGARTRVLLTAGFAELTGDLGVPSFAALRARTRDVERSLPRVSDLANAIIAANPEIEG